MKTFKLILDSQNNQETFKEDGSLEGMTINNHYKSKILEDLSDIGFLNTQISINFSKLKEEDSVLALKYVDWVKLKYSEFIKSLSEQATKIDVIA